MCFFLNYYYWLIRSIEITAFYKLFKYRSNFFLLFHFSVCCFYSGSFAICYFSKIEQTDKKKEKKTAWNVQNDSTNWLNSREDTHFLPLIFRSRLSFCREINSHTQVYLSVFVFLVFYLFYQNSLSLPPTPQPKVHFLPIYMFPEVVFNFKFATS